MSFKRSYFLAKTKLFRPEYIAWDRRFSEHDTWSPDRLAEHSWQLVREQVAHCAATVPYYQRLFEKIGFEPGDLKHREDFAKLPPLEKDDIRQHGEELWSRHHLDANVRRSVTSGSTGVPVQTVSDKKFPLNVLSWRFLRWWGVGPWSNSGYVHRNRPRGWKKPATTAALWPTRRVYLDAFKMNNESMAVFCDGIRKIKAQYVIGYTGVIDTLSRYIRREGLEFPDLKCVWTTSAPLPDFLRRHIGEAFGKEVYTQYGSCEFYHIAAECEAHAGMHIPSDARHVEIAPGADGTPVERDGTGDLLVTDLVNKVMPLLRYRLGDRGRLLEGACPCGRNLPRMDYVNGRTVEDITLSDGTLVSGSQWLVIMNLHAEQLRGFQVYQHADYSCEVRYDPEPGHEEGLEASIAEAIHRDVAPGVPFVFKKQAIDTSVGNKKRLVISEVEAKI